MTGSIVIGGRVVGADDVVDDPRDRPRLQQFEPGHAQRRGRRRRASAIACPASAGRNAAEDAAQLRRATPSRGSAHHRSLRPARSLRRRQRVVRWRRRSSRHTCVHVIDDVARSLTGSRPSRVAARHRRGVLELRRRARRRRRGRRGRCRHRRRCPRCHPGWCETTARPAAR